LFLKKAKEALGLDKAKVLTYAAAPLKQATTRYFASWDMPLLNIYGLSETSGAVTV